MNDLTLSHVRPLTAEHPFPGPHSYREVDSDFFRGRRAETAELTRLILRNPLTVLFGASGLGKSSLLSAGLFPGLRSRDHLPVRINLKYDAPTSENGPMVLARQIMAGVQAEARKQGLELDRAEECSTLWEFFHRLEIWSAKPTLLRPVIVLDQFEDAFVFAGQTVAVNAAVRHLIRGLGDVVENRVPMELEREVGEERRNAIVALSRRTPQVRIVISLREEYVPHLEAVRHDIPSFIKSRMRLLPFEGDRAARAMARSAPEILTHDVARAIVRAVAGKRAGRAPMSIYPPSSDAALEGMSIEPSLLNLFCYQLNERRLASPAPSARIDEALVASASANILNDFYEDCMRGQSLKVRAFVEDRLLSSGGYRLPVPLAEALDEYGIAVSAIDELVQKRLIRSETRNETEYLLLVHDVLAQTIRESRLRRKTEALRRILKVSVPLAALGSGFFLFFLFQVGRKGDEAYLELSPKVQEARGEFERLQVDLANANGQIARIKGELEVAVAARAASDVASERAQAQARAAAHLRDAARGQQVQAEQGAQRARESAVRARRDAETAAQQAVAAQERLASLQSEALELQRTVERLKRRTGIPAEPR